MMSPIPFLTGSRTSNNRSMTQSQNATLSSKEKKYMANVEKALQTFESVDEWADYIAFLAKLQKALLTNPDMETTNWVPYDFQVSMTLSKCISPALPSGVHKKTIELYSTIFKILKVENMSKSISLWLPGILPLMAYASISIKQELLDLYSDYICKIEPKIIRACFKSILLSLLPALDDTTSEFFNSTLELFESLKSQLNDIHHFWQCLLLTIITSPDKRVGAMEYLSRKFPSFAVSIDKDEEVSKDTILAKLSVDAVACLTPDSGLMVKALCEAMNDENLFVQRGFFDLLLAKLPLKSAVYKHLLSESDNELLFLHVTNTVLRKDMSLNRRLWNWLLGPESQDGTIPSSGMSRLEYFQTYSLKTLSNALSRLVDLDTERNRDKEDLLDNYVKVCSISIAIMDKWEIGQSILPQLLVPILDVSKYISDTHPANFEKILKYSNEVFDGVETNVIWSKILDLITNNRIELVLFILKSYNVADEDMIVTHVPLTLLATFSSFRFELIWIQLIESLIKLIPQRALLPLDLSNEKYLSMDYYTQDTKLLNETIMRELNNYYEKFKNVAEDAAASKERPYNANDLAALYLGFTCSIMIESLESNSEIFLCSTRIFDSLIAIIPPSKSSKTWNIVLLREKVKLLTEGQFDVHVSVGISHIFKYLMKDLTKLEVLKLLKIVLKSLWNCLEDTEGEYQVEIVKEFWSLEMIVDTSYVEAALCELLLESNFEQRLRQFNILWTHLNNDNNESKMILCRPLYLILDELKDDLYLSLITKWIKSTMSSGTLNKIFRIVCMELFNNEFIEENFQLDDINEIDFSKVSFELDMIFNLLNIDADVLKNFKTELCVIDNSKQIDFIKTRNWDISTYKSFLIVVLFKFLEFEPTKDLELDNTVFTSYLKCLRSSLKLINLLVDGNETNFEEMITSLIQNCEENCISKAGPDISITNSYYLESITKMIKLSSKNLKKDVSLFDNNEKVKKPINLLDFVTIGISSCKKEVEFSSWIDLISSTAEYYPDLVFQICPGLIDCICNKIENSFLSSIEDSGLNITLVENSICELIIGMEKILVKCHKHLGYILSNNFGFGSMSGTGTVKESGFFGTVIQGVFQVEATDEKNEGTKRKRSLIQSFRRSVFTVYQIWIACEKRLTVEKIGQANEPEIVEKLSNGKTVNYYANKVKFRCKKIIENTYLMEPLETIEALIEFYEASNTEVEKLSKFKLIQILDDCKQKIILPYILDSITSRVNYLSLDETKRSSLTSKLNESQLSLFLIEYCKKSDEYEQIEEVWPDIQNFLKDVFSNVSYYKHIYSNILRFFCVISWKIEKTKFGQSRRVKKEISENLIRNISQCITIKIGPNQNTNTLSAVMLQSHVNDIDNEKSSSNHNSIHSNVNNGTISGGSVSSREKLVFREDVCIALKEVIPYLKPLINDNDKLLATLNSIINGISTFILKNGSLVSANLPDHIVDLLVVLSEDETCESMKAWKSLCQEILNDDIGFFSIDVSKMGKWNIVMKNWILSAEQRLGDMISNRLIFSSGANNSSTLLFNWNDEVEILNGNIPLIKKIIYLLLINEKDEFIGIIGDLLRKLDDLFKAFRQMTKQHCQLESWILILLRTIFFKFSESHLTEAWSLVDKELFYMFNEAYLKVVEEAEEDNDEMKDKTDKTERGVKDEEDQKVFDMLFLQGCKLLDVLVVLGQEEFQLSEWIFISDNMDGIFNSSVEGEDVGIVEKMGKRHTKYKVGKNGGVSEDAGGASHKKKVPILTGIRSIENVMELKRFFNMLKVRKYENEYAMKTVDEESIFADVFADVFTA